MKHIQQILKSSTFLIGGLVVLGFSLHFTHVQQTMAAGNEMVQPSPTPASLFDSHMPGSVPYLFNRMEDRMIIWQEDSSQHKAEKFLQYALHRMQSAEYALSVGNYEVAQNTLSKSLGYIAQAHMVCEGFSLPECDSQQEFFQQTLSVFTVVTEDFLEKAPSDESKADLQHLLSRSAVFYQQ